MFIWNHYYIMVHQEPIARSIGVIFYPVDVNEYAITLFNYIIPLTTSLILMRVSDYHYSKYTSEKSVGNKKKDKRKI